MSSPCPDWRALAARRAAEEAEEPPAWRDALGHLDGCPRCRDAALAAEPTLLFRRLPAVEAEADEIEAMRAGVRALRRAGRVAEPLSERPARRALGARGWRRAAAAAVLVGGLVTVQPELDRPATVGAAGLAADDPFAGGALPPIAWLDADGASMVDDIENPAASVYHFDDDEVAVVMVVDAGLDV